MEMMSCIPMSCLQISCHPLPTLLAQVGKLGDPKPLPVFQSRVSESGVIEVNV